VKGLLNLAAAWGRLAGAFPGWHLIIAGPDEGNHRADVEAALRANGVFDRTTFTGPVSGNAKTQLYCLSDLFVLPTFSENFGVVVAEALAAGCPVITTTGTPWKELEECQCGWRIAIGAEPLAKALREAMSLPEEQRKAMGLRGREMVRERFSWDAIAKQTIELYMWACGKGPLPAHVQLP
jgi:glycosyltransferase involved in cell wall biosynthesis